jgi:hypothetical protein
MARIVISNAKKKKLMEDAESGKDIESWMFEFISHDPGFQAELFRKAETVKNWRFLSSLSDFRAAKQRQAIAASAAQEAKIRHKERIRKKKSQRFLASIRRSVRRLRGPKLWPQPPLDPNTLPAKMVIRVRSTDFTSCPKCKLHLLKKVLKDHLEFSCPQRLCGSAVSSSIGRRKSANGIVFCRCGAPAIPGDTCCYDHKHT